MNLNSYKLFAQLCEGFITEASSSLDLLKSQPGGSAVIQKLHKEKGLSHDQNYTSIPKIQWSELKGSYKGAWVLMQGTTGVGAIKATGGSYEAVASNGGEVQSFRDDRGGNILDFFKGVIGKPVKIYVGNETGKRKEVTNKRAELNKVTGPSAVTHDTLLKKFKPLWVKAITAAQADIKGMVGMMIKNDAFSKAKKKIQHLETLDEALQAVEAGNENASEVLSTAMGSAVAMAASHHYPEQTGNIERTRWGGRGSVSTQFNEGPRLLLADIANGDQKKLGTVLAFFKRSLIAG